MPKSLLNLYSEPQQITLQDIQQFESTLKSKTNVEIYPLKYEQIVFSLIPQLKCIQCGSYMRFMHCPPHNPKYYQIQQFLRKFNFFRLIISKESSQPWYDRNKKFGASEYMTKYRACNTANAIAIGKLRQSIKNYRNFLFGYTIKTHGFDNGGGCKNCGPKPCAILTKEPCRHPNDAMCSPESCGIDLYTTVRSLGIHLEVPPTQNVSSIGIICSQIPNYTEQNSITTRAVIQNIPDETYLKTLFKDTPYENCQDIYALHDECKSCTKTSDFLCDKSLFLEEHLHLWLANRRLYTVILDNPISTIKGINELYQKYTLPLLRKGYWWIFTFANSRCNACESCNMKHHFEEGFKLVQNRRIIRCIKYFNLHPKAKSLNIAYVLI